MDQKTEILFHAEGWSKQEWVSRFVEALPDFNVRLLGQIPDPDKIKYGLLWRPPAEVFYKLRNLEVIFSLGAGVDHILDVKGLPKNIPIVRVVNDDLTFRMSEYIILHCLIFLRRQREFDDKQRRAEWSSYYQPAAKRVRIGILGLGEIGLDAAKKLKMIGFNVAGWSRSKKTIEGIATFHGPQGLKTMLARTDILVSLLPSTPATRGLINYDLLRQLPDDGALDGAMLINAGRGDLQIETDILKALDDGTLKAATLDVFQQEPLPTASSLWQHDAVTITPHCAADSDPQAICKNVAEQIIRFEAGGKLENVVSRSDGY